MLRLWNLH